MNYNIQIIDTGITNYKAYNPVTVAKNIAATIKVDGDLAINESERRLKVAIGVKVFLYPEEINSIEDISQGKGHDLQLIGEIATFSLFDVNGEWANMDFNATYPIDEKFQRFVLNISYNNTRGLLKERGKGDFIGKITIPLFFPEMIKNEKIKID